MEIWFEGWVYLKATLKNCDGLENVSHLQSYKLAITASWMLKEATRHLV